MDRVYLDTSFFVGLIENQDNREEEARRILTYEQANDRFTSILTLNEFTVRVFDDHKHDANCDELLQAAEIKIRSVARIEALSEEVCKEAARLQSVFGEIHKHPTPPKEPRDRKFRWDAIHIATAKLLGCNRIYAWDEKWSKWPDQIKQGLGDIISPARCPILLIDVPPKAALDSVAPIAPVPEDATSVTSSEPPPPSGQSPAAPPVSTSPPEPFPPSDLPAVPEPQQQPGEGPPAVGPPGAGPQSPSE
jgi:predicted nucleic acid-binding protein